MLLKDFDNEGGRTLEDVVIAMKIWNLRTVWPGCGAQEYSKKYQSALVWLGYTQEYDIRTPG